MPINHTPHLGGHPIKTTPPKKHQKSHIHFPETQSPDSISHHTQNETTLTLIYVMCVPSASVRIRQFVSYNEEGGG